jgi:hypothetical protein
MSPDAVYRLEELLAMVPESSLGSLGRFLECRATISDLRDALIGQTGGALTLIEGLDPDTRSTLQHLASVVPMSAPASAEETSPELRGLIERGLAYLIAIQDNARVHVPLEIQQILHARERLSDPDLRVMLAALEDEDLDRFEDIYGPEPAAEDQPHDPNDRACRIAEAMETLSTLREIYHSLPEAAREVLGWTCEHSGPIGTSEVTALANDAERHHKERLGVAVGQLLRVGLLMTHELDESGDVYLVPRSLRSLILSLVDYELTSLCRAGYEKLVTSGNLGFPDEGPRGWGGDAMRAFRQLAVSWVSGQIDELPHELGVAVGLQIVEPSRPQAAAFSSLLLDLSGETALARQALRLWLALADDPWTVDLIGRMGGDASGLSSYFAEADPDIARLDGEVWYGHLFLLRAQLLFVMSLLPPGRWYAVADLAQLFHWLVGRSTLANLHHESLSPQFPYEALPDYGVVISREDRLEDISSWLEAWLVEFASVIGAAEMEPSGTFFRVHPDAFCVFRDSDLWFRTLWDDLGSVVGDDLDLWMPIPNDPGVRIRGVSAVRATGGRRLLVPKDAHVSDLLKLARWSRTVVDPAGFGFELDRNSVDQAIENGLDGEELLTWLAVRLQDDIPTAIRMLFPQSSSVVDGPADGWRAAATDRVEELLLSLESWGVSPPSRLLEEIRGWSSIAAKSLVARLKAITAAGTLDDPMLQHICILLGELGARDGVEPLLEVLQTVQPESTQHAAAAALMRIGLPCLAPLVGILSSQTNPKELRLLAAMTLTGLATLNPDTYTEVGRAILRVVETSTFDGDFQTRLVLELCRMGHPQADPTIDHLEAEGEWHSEEWQPEDARWLARISPCVWGSLLFSSPLSVLYLVSDEADELARESGVRELLQSAGLSSESLLYGRPRPPRES